MQEAHSRRFTPLKLSSVVSSSTKPRSILKKGANTLFGHRGGLGNIRLCRDKQPVSAEVRNPSASRSPLSLPPSLHYVVHYCVESDLQILQAAGCDKASPS